MRGQLNTESSPSIELSEILAIVEAVLVYERQLIPAGSNKTFFSVNDLWLFLAVYDTRMCWKCHLWNNVLITGDHLRSLFPMLEIVDVDTINANIHPNCRCTIRRFRWPY